MSETSASTDAAFCASLVREHDFDRYASTLFVAPEIRRALLSLSCMDHFTPGQFVRARRMMAVFRKQ